MEAQLGAQLFERTNGGTRPTVAGREFLASAQHILADTDAAQRSAAQRRLQTRARGENGRLAIGIRCAGLMSDARVVAGRRHSIMGAKIFVSTGQFGLGVAVEIAEGR
jgi:DNA-binding transcriptional LysR family regulator